MLVPVGLKTVCKKFAFGCFAKKKRKKKKRLNYGFMLLTIDSIGQRFSYRKCVNISQRNVKSSFISTTQNVSNSALLLCGIIPHEVMYLYFQHNMSNWYLSKRTTASDVYEGILKQSVYILKETISAVDSVLEFWCFLFQYMRRPSLSSRNSSKSHTQPRCFFTCLF